MAAVLLSSIDTGEERRNVSAANRLLVVLAESSTSLEFIVKQAVIALVALACFARCAAADTWVFPPKLVTKNFEFGRSAFVLEVDGTKDQSFPPHTLLVRLDGELAAKYRNIGFDEIYASENNRFFVGLSNSGIPGTAFVVFDAQGNLLREEKHRFMPVAIYTSRSTTVDRTWYDADRPEVEFEIENGRLRGVLVNGSNGHRYDLLKRNLKFSRFSDPFSDASGPFDTASDPFDKSTK